jgi:hypothetical protein
MIILLNRFRYKPQSGMHQQPVLIKKIGTGFGFDDHPSKSVNAVTKSLLYHFVSLVEDTITSACFNFGIKTYRRFLGGTTYHALPNIKMLLMF